MKTELKRFCDDFGSRLLPVARAVRSTLEEIELERTTFELQPLTDSLQAELESLESLAEKVTGEEAYLIIFGPLKSGKSTLMNAISGTYVSEVSSLPAYPCLVHVRHAPKASFSLTRYNGEVESFERNEDLQQVLREAHVALATALIETEKGGDFFEPAKHFPEAIRDIDISLPANRLGEAGAVLVDTPGLYAKMRFGYDRLTKKFRDHASCAIFVVKADNLFLEQVFEEFNELLGFFSRIYLVVNIDKSKRDLLETGELVPSLESTDPDRIIATFESLSMNAQIRQAFDERRLRIYPIDLLEVAREILVTERGGSGAPIAISEGNEGLPPLEPLFAEDSIPSPEVVLEGAEELATQLEAEDEESVEFAGIDTEISPELEENLDDWDLETGEKPVLEGASAETEGEEVSEATDGDEADEWDEAVGAFDIPFTAGSEVGVAEGEASIEEAGDLMDPLPIEKDIGIRRFKQFSDELEAYLNGSDYLREFMSDHLRRGERVVARFETAFSSLACFRFERLSDQLAKELGEADARLEAATRLGEIDWHALLEPLNQEAASAVSADAGRYRDRLQVALAEAVDTWFEKTSSFADLLEKDVPAVLGNEKKAMIANSRNRVKALVEAENGGVRFSNEQHRHFGLLGIDLIDRYKRSAEPLEAEVEDQKVKLSGLKLDGLTLRKKPLDFVFLRGAKGIFKAVFGDPETLDKEVKPEDKEQRLGDAGRAELKEMIQDQAIKLLLKSPGEDSLARLGAFGESFREQVQAAVSDGGEHAASQLRLLREKRAKHARLLESLAELKKQIRGFGNELSEVRAEHLMTGTGGGDAE